MFWRWTNDMSNQEVIGRAFSAIPVLQFTGKLARSVWPKQSQAQSELTLRITHQSKLWTSPFHWSKLASLRLHSASLNKEIGVMSNVWEMHGHLVSQKHHSSTSLYFVISRFHLNIESMHKYVSQIMENRGLKQSFVSESILHKQCITPRGFGQKINKRKIYRKETLLVSAFQLRYRLGKNIK